MNRFHFKLGLAFLLFAVGAALASDAAVERFGDLSYDKSMWTVAAAGGAFSVQAKDEDARTGDVAFISIKPAGEDICSLADFPERREGYYGRTNISTIKRPGFDIHVAEYDIGCRNWRPPTVEACTTYKDKTYRFSSPVIGCRGGPPRGRGDGFVGFLKTLSAPD